MIAAATAPTKDGLPMYDTSVGWNLVVDALKSLDQLVQAGELRRHLIEEMADAMILFADTTACMVCRRKNFLKLTGKNTKRL